ncbi:MAG: beta strand repeat-containing protein [Cypionkella sp.]
MARNRFLAAYLLGATFLPSALYASDLPTDPTVVSGDVTIGNPSANQMLLSQTTDFGVVDWGSFSIGQGFGVQINNGAGSTLNRVTGTELSSIMGSLNATGSVFLINPNGIIVGKTGVIDTGGRFVASTLDTSNADFLNGGDTTFAGTSDAYVVNLGKVSSMGGDVALLARNVVNEGTLSAPNGTVGVIAGREILMRDASVNDGMFAVKVGGADTSVTEAGAIKAAAAELRAKGGNVYALAGNTTGTIEATGVAKVAGRVFLTADGGSLKVDKTVKAKNVDGSGGKIVAHAKTVDLTGKLDASGTKGGTVLVKGTEDTSFAGEIYATGDNGGDGGFVEVSGGHLTFAGDVQTGGGTVLIDPDNLEISFNNSALLSDATLILPSDITSLLDSQNVIIETSADNGFAGTIVVSSGVFWNSDFSLTLLAQGDIWFNASVQNASEAGGDLNVVAGWDGVTGITGFDATVFNSANLASQSLFGKSTGAAYVLNGTNYLTWGTVYVSQGNNFNAVAVGAKGGDTRVYADNLFVLGSRTDANNAYAQLGYNVSTVGDAGTISGDISVRATGSVLVIGGALSGNAAQIGHVGLNASGDSGGATVAVTGAISIEALGDLLLQADPGAGNNDNYAMIGNGALTYSFATAGDRSGDITINVGSELSLDAGAPGVVDGVWIGPASGFGTVAGNVSLTAGAIDESAATTVGSGGMGMLNIALLVRDALYGNVKITTTNSALTLEGSTELITCECSYISAPGDFIVQTSGDLVLGTSFSFGNTESNVGAGDSGGALVLASGGNVINNAGAGAIGQMMGQWIIYSDRPDHDTGTLGVLTPLELFFGRAFDPADPLDPTQLTGNAFVYVQQPLVVVSDATITYGDTFTSTPVTMYIASSSEIIADPSTWGFNLSAPYLDSAAVTLSGDNFVNAGAYDQALKVDVSTSVAEFVTSYGLGYGKLTVDPATIVFGVGDQTKTYDGLGYSGFPSITYDSKFTTIDANAVFATAIYSYAGGDGSGVNAGTYTVSASGVSEASGNFVFDLTGTGQLVIDPATITVTLGDQTKTYDGIGGYTGAVSYVGFVGSDTAALITAGPTFGYGGGTGVNAGTYTVSASGTAESSGNYVFNQTDTAQLVIDPATITVSLGDQTKTYDGLGYSGAVSYAGFVGSDTAALITAGPTFLYDGGDSAGVDVGTYSVTASGTEESSGNYVFNESATVQLVIDPATITVTLGDQTKTYDGIGGYTGAVSYAGFVGSDTAALITAGPTFGYSGGTGSGAGVNAGTYTVTASGTQESSGNYVFNQTDTAQLVIDPATITVSLGDQTKTYDGIGGYTGAVSYAGFIGNDTATLISAGPTFGYGGGTGVNAGTYTVSASGTQESSGNYIFDQTDTAQLVIDPATLTVSLGDQTKTYDGVGGYTGLLGYLGFVGSDTAALITAGPSFAFSGADGSGRNAGTYTVLASGAEESSGNYVFDETDTAQLVIDPKALTAGIVGSPTKVYDGTDQAVLTSANFQISGLVAGESASILQTSGTYDSPAGGARSITASIAPSDFVAGTGTLASNYILPTTATGPGVIVASPPPVLVSAGPTSDSFSTTPLGAPTGPADKLQLIDTETTKQILDQINAGANFCREFVSQEYAIDCLSDRLQATADGLSATGEYSEVRAALEDAARKLHALALSNQSSVLSSVVARSTSGAIRSSSRPLVAVSGAALASANAAASAIIVNTQLVLLRSASNSERRRVAFQQVGQILGTTKVLLRSS